jgi:uncharacterized protein (TIGR03382 family)
MGGGDMRKALAIGALLVCPFAARAQTFTLTSPDALSINNATPQIFIGADDCASKALSFHWDLSPLGGLSAGQQVNIVHARAASTCTATTGIATPDTIVPAPSQNTTGDDTVTAQSLILDLDAGLPGGCNNTNTSSAAPWTTFYCVQVSSNSLGTGATAIAQDIQINFATAPPLAPGDIVLEPGDGHIKVAWQPGNAGENIASYDVHVVGPNETFDLNRVPDGHEVQGQLNADVNTTDTGAALVDGQDYLIAVVANDRYKNQSQPSVQVTGTPIQVLDFYGLYRKDNGQAKGGCSSAGAATWITLLALATALLARRRKKARNGALLIVFFSLCASKAEAAGYERSPRFLLVELKVDRYDPKVDSEKGLNSNPYHQVFGPRAPLRWQLEADWEAWHPFGTLLVGGTVGYWQNFGKGFVANTGERSNDTALLDIIPFGAVLTYRFDRLTDLYPRFPIIPYVQAGLMSAFWASFNGTGAISKDPVGHGHGSGWTLGYTTALGVALALDAIDPDLSREAYQDTGLQRSSLFAEYGWTRLDGFRNGSSLVLSDRAWRFGIAVEF